MENFAQISVMKQNIYYNPWEMKTLFCDFLNYISHCVFLISKATKQTVFVVCCVTISNCFVKALYRVNLPTEIHPTNTFWSIKIILPR